MFFLYSTVLLWKCCNTALLLYLASKLCEPIGIVTSVGVIQDSSTEFRPNKEFLKWVPGEGGEVPPNAVAGGSDGDRGETVYVGRAVHDGCVIPGKVVCSHGVCYVAWQGEEHAKDKYEVLTTTKLQWLPGLDGQVPSNAVVGGASVNGETLYICRATHKGTMTVGKIKKSCAVCFIPYDGQEIGKSNYEVLVQL